MKKLIIGLILSVYVVSVFADPAVDSVDSKSMVVQLQKVNMTLMQVHDALLKSKQTMDPKVFCYHEDKAYSEGDKLNGLTCTRREMFDPYERNKPIFPLLWAVDVHTKTAAD